MSKINNTTQTQNAPEVVPAEQTEPVIRLLNEYLALNEQAKEIKTRMDEIKDLLALTFPDGAVIDGHKLSTTQRRFDKKRAAEAFPRDKYPELWLAFDDKQAKLLLEFQGTLDDYYNTERRVSIR